MLVLSRKVGETILIPDCDLRVTVVAVTGNRVRLSISAPTQIAVYREEVWHRSGKQTHISPGQEQGRGRNEEASP